MIGIAVVLAALLVTGIHEAGHLAVARARGAAVLGVQVGYGMNVLAFRRGGTEYAFAILPLGGRVRCERLGSEAANAAIAVGGPAANVVFAVGILAVAAIILGVDAMPGGGDAGHAVAYTAGTVTFWAGLVPRILAGWIGWASPASAAAAFGTLADVVTAPGLAGKLYFVAALSTLWGALNLIPIPVVRTDGWHLAAAVFRAVRRGRAP